MKQPTIPRNKELLIKFLESVGFLNNTSRDDIVNCTEEPIQFAFTRIASISNISVTKLCLQFISWTRRNETFENDAITGRLTMTSNREVTLEIMKREYRKLLSYESHSDSRYQSESLILSTPFRVGVLEYDDSKIQKVLPNDLVPNGTVKLWNDEDLVPNLD